MGRRRGRHPCPAAAARSAAALGGRGPADGRARVHGALPERPAGGARRCVQGLGLDLARLRQRLHVLHRAARPGAAALAVDRRHPGRGPGPGAERGRRGDAAGAEREHLRARRDRAGLGAQAPVRAAAPGGRPGRRSAAAQVHLAPPARLHARRDRRHGRVRHHLRAHPLPAAVGLGRRPEGDAAFLPPRAVPGLADPDPRRDPGDRRLHRHHRGLPRRDGSGLPGHARPRGACRLRLGLHVPVLPAARHPGGDDAGPGAEGGRPGTVRPPGDAPGAISADGNRRAGRADLRGVGGGGLEEGPLHASADPDEPHRPSGRCGDPRLLRPRADQTEAAAHHLRGVVVPAPVGAVA